jgi:predicted dehydrogenase
MRLSSPLRVGLLGYGLAGRVFHAPLIAATPELELAAVVTANEDRTREVRRRHPEVVVLPSADALVDRVDELGLGLAVVATPNRFHVPLARRALEAGLAVVVDKPLAPSAAEGRALVTESERRALPLTVFHNRRLDGDLLTIRRLLSEGALGTVVRFESRWDRWRPTPSVSWREKGGADEAGGVLFDLGSHLVDQALHLFGDVAEVYGEVDRRRPGAEVDDDVFIALRHVSGVRSHLGSSSLAGLPGPRFRVLGDRAAYLKYGLDVQEERLKAGADPRDPDWSREPEEAWGMLGAEGQEHRIPTEPGGFADFYPAVAAAVLHGGPLPVDPHEAVRVLEILEEARWRGSGGAV